MSNKEVDLSQIRGDWDFHSRYVTNAVEQTLKRLNSNWRELKKTSKKKDQVAVDGVLMDEFIEACSQTRALCDDFLILAVTQGGPKPAGKKSAAKKSTPKKVSKKKAKKPAKKTAKKSGGKKAAKKGGAK